ncbi:MAG: putative toxin-antitoxin system toxin component, PIN family [Deltaproteobacteria bacterium]|nr:putative toxin-antitoxin system toxin component, PIN family [Deltaproteobacteria bacterium]
MNVVLDTNVIVSGIIKPDGSPAKLLNMVVNGTLTINADTRILSEYGRVLNSPKFSFPETLITQLLHYISSESKLVTPDPFLLPVKDPSDLPFIEIAVQEDIPLITGNIKHFEDIENIRLYSPTRFLEKFGL